MPVFDVYLRTPAHGQTERWRVIGGSEDVDIIQTPNRTPDGQHPVYVAWTEYGQRRWSIEHPRNVSLRLVPEGKH